MDCRTLLAGCTCVALLAVCSSALASLEAARGFAHGMVEELGLAPTDCPERVVGDETGEEHVCARTDEPFRKFAQAWESGAPRRAPRGVKQFSRWGRDGGGHGQQLTYEIQGTPLAVLYVTRGKTVVISYSDYSWNEWPCPDEAPPGVVFADEVPDIVAPKRLVGAFPEFPEIARVARLQGSVGLEATIDESGRVVDVCVRRMYNRDVGFEREAVKAVRQWRYEPAVKDGVAMPVRFTVDVDFKLH